MAAPRYPLRSALMLTASFPVAASFVVLAAADVGRGTWSMHFAALVIAVLIVLSGRVFDRVQGRGRLLNGVITVSILVLAATLLREAEGPSRWIAMGPINLYVAPVVIPVFLAVCSVRLPLGDRAARMSLIAAAAVGVLLAIQPDASQALACLLGVSVLLLRGGITWQTRATAVLAMALIVGWSFFQPDPLMPIAHVEGVFRLALEASLLSGILVIASALVFIGGLLALARRGHDWLPAVAAYYAVLFLCSVAGMTPAPLIGYGAGPLIGFALLIAMSGSITASTASDSQSGMNGQHR